MISTSWSGLSDEQLMTFLRAGELDPLGELYVRHGGMVKDALMRFCPELSVAGAEDLAHEVFLALAQTAPKYQEQSRFKAWLYGIAIKKVSGWRRTYWVRRKLLERHADSPVGMARARFHTHGEDIETRDTLTRALSKLKKGQQEVLYLNAVEGFTGEEIAGILGIRPKTVWTRLHRARQRMLELVKEDSSEPVLCKGET